MNSLYTNDDHEQTYPEQPKIINSTIGDDQINSNIIFDDLYVKVNNGSVDHDKNVHDSYELEQLAKNAYKEAEKYQVIVNKVKQQNVVLTKQLERYKERVRVFKTNTTNKTIFQTKFIEADLKVKRLETELQNQFIRDRDKIRVLEQERDALQLKVSELKKKILELQDAQSVLKLKMNADEDKYLDDILNLEAKVKTNENVVIKMSLSVQALFMLGPKPFSYYDPKLKHGLGYENPYTLKKAIAHNPLEDATKSQIKMENKLKDPIAIEKKQNFHTIDYKKLNALYETFFPQKELFC
ncbi:hypothetical protein Tco_0446697 [Tanacetum coccineum]